MTGLAADVARVLAADAVRLEGARFPVGIGPLAPLVTGVVRGLSAGDWWVPGPRERAGGVLRDVSSAALRDDAFSSRPYRVAPLTVAPALRALHAVGLALAEPTRAVAVHLGVGALADGALAEALNLAALTSARVIFVVAVIPLDGAPVPRQSAASPAALAAAWGVSTVSVDGTDATAVRDAVLAARASSGPTLVAASLGSPR